MANAKAAKPARRKTAKKQQVGGKKPRALSKRDMEIAGYLTLSCDPDGPKGPGGARHLGRPARLKGKSKAVDASRIEDHIMTCGRRYNRLVVGVSTDVDVVVKKHRAVEEHTDKVMLGVIPPSKKAKKVAIRLTKKKHPNRGKKQQLVRPKLIHNHRILLEGREMDAESAAHQEAEWQRMFTYGAPNKTARRPQEVVVM